VILKWNSVTLTLARIVGHRCLLLCRIETRIYGEIKQSMKNARKQLNTPAWHRRPTDKLSAAAVRRSTKSAAVAPTNCRRRRASLIALLY